MSRSAEFSLAPESSAASLHSTGATIALSQTRGALALAEFAMFGPDVGLTLRRIERAQAHLARLHGHVLARKGVRR